jgi:NADP-dependent 3-hydroxy acid dehydrogenase YdfG
MRRCETLNEGLRFGRLSATSTIRAQTGCIDVLVNNAGIERTGSIEGLSLDDFKATMETNYFGALRSIRAWLAEMRKRQSGCIQQVSVWATLRY